MKAAVIGAGAWGTALALVLNKNGLDVTLWFRDNARAEEACKTRCNPRLPHVQLPESLNITSAPSCVSDCDLVVLASPSFPYRSVCQKIAPYLSGNAALVSVTKGIEKDTLYRMSQIAVQETGHKFVTVLSGPCHAEEVAIGLPTGCVAACEDRAHAELVQNAFMSDSFRVYTSPDTVGVELGGALKNVIALCSGVCTGLGYGDNTKAMLMTRGLTEIARLGVSLGARRDTIAGLSGIGDLIVTCTSMHSRNYRAGIMMGQGMSPEDAMQQVGAVVEGYYAAASAYSLARREQVEMPIVTAAYKVLYEHAEPRQAVSALLLRDKKPESENVDWL